MLRSHGGRAVFEPEPISAVLTGVALVLTAIGGFAFRRGTEKGKKPDPVEEMRRVMEENTSAMRTSNAQFLANNGLFQVLNGKVDAMNLHLKEIERDGSERLQVLRAIRDEDLRKGNRR